MTIYDSLQTLSTTYMCTEHQDLLHAAIMHLTPTTCASHGVARVPQLAVGGVCPPPPFSSMARVMIHDSLQLLEALKASHRTGIVHRDVKPQNVIISETDNKVKFIDMGAAADLRVGINYVPNEYLLDPRYAPPQQYIMSTQVC